MTTPLLKISVGKVVLDHQKTTVAKAKKKASKMLDSGVKKAQSKHVWKNRTQQAELKLHGGISNGQKLGKPTIDPNNGFYIYIAHGAVEKRPSGDKKYGFYLETMQGGKYAVLASTLYDVWMKYISSLPQGK